MTQLRTLFWRMHSLGVQVSQIQNAHFLQHLQQQQEQQLLTINNKMVNVILPRVVVSILNAQTSLFFFVYHFLFFTILYTGKI
jgi:hypothetical protein